MTSTLPSLLTPKHELTPPLIPISLEWLLSLACRSFDGYAVVGPELVGAIKQLDPKEEYTHVEPANQIGNLYYLYPIAVWRETSIKFYREKQRAEEERQYRFNQEARLAQDKELYQRKRDILAESKADVMKLYPNVLLVVGKGLPSWQQQVERLEYLIFKALSGQNEAIRVKFALSMEICDEFQKLPPDPAWKNSIYMGEQDLLM